jgi:hypothetical protein
MQRAFIVGNGPSLSQTNLDLLIGEVSFACNRISLIYGETDWRPNYYIRSEGLELNNEPDPSLWQDDIHYHLDHPDIDVYCNAYFTKHLGTGAHGAKRLKLCTHYLKHYDDDECPYMWHLPFLCSYGSSVNVALQLAVQLGYGPLYLIGCDLGYRDGEPSHFTDEYESGYEDMLRPARYANLDTLNAHIIAARSCPVPIFNATKGGDLEVYERVNYERLFE